MRSVRPVSQALIYIIIFLCLILVLWAIIEAWDRPCRRLITEHIAIGSDCPSATEEIITLVVAVGLWLAGLWALRLDVLPTSFFFLYLCASLAIGAVSAGGSDGGSRLFSICLAWAPVVVVFTHRRLLEEEHGSRGRSLIIGMVIIASCFSIPPTLWEYGALRSRPWSTVWLVGLYLGALVALVFTLARFVWHASRSADHVKSRPARLMAFGNLAGGVPLALLSLIPELLHFPVTLPWELAFPGLLVSPLFYIFALQPEHPIGRSGLLKRFTLIYAMTVFYIFSFLVAIALLDQTQFDPTRDWPTMAALVLAGCVLIMLPVYRRLERLVDWVWLGNRERRSSLLAETATFLGADPTAIGLKRTLVDTVRTGLGLTGAALFLANGSRRLALVADTGLGLELQDLVLGDSRLVRYLARQTNPISHRQVSGALDGAYVDDAGRALLSRDDIAVWVPLVSETSLRGLLLAGHKAGGDYYVREDYQVLAVLAQQAGLAIYNMQLAEDRVRIQKQLAQAQKMEAVGRLAGGVAHDFNNLLTIINGYSEMLIEMAAPDDNTRGELEQIHQAGQRAAGLTRQLLAFSRRQTVKPKVLDLNDLLVNLGKMLSRLIGEDIELVLQLSAQAGEVLADPGQIEQIIMNLAVNARDAMPDGGTLTIKTANTDTLPASALCDPDMGDGPYVVVTVGDTGVGMSTEVQQHLFEPFFTTKGIEQGTGLGLAIVWSSVRENNGAVAFESELDRGTHFSIYFPRVNADAEQVSLADGRGTGGQETILLVEDQEPVRMLTARLLHDLGYRVLTATDGRDALRRFQLYSGRIDLLFSDMVMPGMGGIELAEIMQKTRTNLHVLFMTGHSERAAAADIWDQASGELLHKPFTAVALADAVRRALDARD